MRFSFRGPVLSLLALAAAADARAASWQMQYAYDKGKSTLSITDIQFPSARRGVAVGILADAQHRKPVAVVTADGGAHWQTVPLPATPVSLFFLNENLGWMVTTRGLFRSTEAGKGWQALPHTHVPLVRVFFADENRGWAVGFKKSVLETSDGGKQWKPVAAAAEQPGDAKFSAYNWVSFATPQLGIITGWNRPPRAFQPRLPEWIDPEAAIEFRDRPHLSYTLFTGDGGKTWKSRSASMFGEVARIRFGAGNIGLGLVEYSEAFRFPSEVYKVEWVSGKSQTVYRDRKFFVTDVWMGADGTGYLAGTILQGEIRIVPGRVQVLRSKDLVAWTEMDVDYRAVARRTMLAASDDQNIWLATDNGMILKLAQ